MPYPLITVLVYFKWSSEGPDKGDDHFIPIVTVYEQINVDASAIKF